MIPHLLSLEGLYSYREPVTIDFAPLLDAHLFGIFGAVGSGKSSILEAITFALFGKVERLNMRENMAANMINLDASRARIEFSFASLVDNQMYFIRVIGKRTQKSADWKREFFRIEESTYIPVEESVILKAVGLSYDHFIRTVIVPQGRFQAFLMLSDKDRTDMLQDLFHLSRFDLGPKLSRMKGKFLGEEQYLSGQIASLNATPDIPDDELIRSLIHYKVESEKAQQNLTILEVKLDLSSQWLELTEQLSAETIHLQSATTLLSGNQESLKNLEIQYQVFNAQWELMPESRNQINYAEMALHVQSISVSIDALSISLMQNRDKIQPVAMELEMTQTALSKLNDQNSTHFKDKVSPEIIRERQQLKDRFELIAQEQIDRTQRGRAIALDKTQQVKQLRDQAFSLVAKAGINVESNADLLTGIATKQAELQKEMVGLEKEIEDLQNKGGLDRLAESLQHGAPCPLCGSLNHPHIHQSKAILKQLDEIKRLLNKTRDNDRLLQQSKQLLAQEPSVASGFDNQLTLLRVDYRNAEEKNKIDLELLKTWGMDVLSIDSWLNKQSALDINIQRIQKDIQSLNSKLSEIQKNFDQLQMQIQESTHRLTTLNVERTTLLNQIPIHVQTKLLATSEADLRAYINGESLRLAELSIHFQTSSKAREHHMQVVQENLAGLKQHNAQIANLKSKIESVLTDIRHKVSDWPSNVQIDYIRLQLSYWSEERKQMQETYTSCMSELRLLQEAEKRQALQKARLAELEHAYKDVQIKLDNLRTLEGLFRGKGMVEFAASRYLSQIIERANGRFYKMTRHKLRMELGEGNRMMVRDYYHNGAMRLIKTLSGGQIFQASLALALSLADQIRKYKEGQRDFFFLDEGFGSQDKESLRIVLDTLKALRAENRCVGIISHVEELKQEVGAYLTVHLDPVKGSQITTNA